MDSDSDEETSSEDDGFGNAKDKESIRMTNHEPVPTKKASNAKNKQ